eukprot:1150652-Amphidinium_carterae.1
MHVKLGVAGVQRCRDQQLLRFRKRASELQVDVELLHTGSPDVEFVDQIAKGLPLIGALPRVPTSGYFDQTLRWCAMIVQQLADMAPSLRTAV